MDIISKTAFPESYKLMEALTQAEGAVAAEQLIERVYGVDLKQVRNPQSYQVRLNKLISRLRRKFGAPIECVRRRPSQYKWAG